jgi:hypothetical protein
VAVRLWVGLGRLLQPVEEQVVSVDRSAVPPGTAELVGDHDGPDKQQSCDD